MPYATTTATAEPKLIAWYDLTPGQCFSGEELKDGKNVATVPCDSPHMYEVLSPALEYAAAGGAYPGKQDTMVKSLVPFCSDKLANAVFKDKRPTGRLSLFPVTPVGEEAWASGERRVVCAVFSGDRRPLGAPLFAAQGQTAGGGATG
ncbi:septum formation family protein [Kitasatospora sp. NPDC057692]|uniref:septum formation family protein n=1 Tax=Kitasatospora sp. NPDC057692 TaxID=3346215 RepID=UPI0036A57A8E